MVATTAMYDLCKELFPIHRSITGDGTRATLNILQRELPRLNILEVPSGTRCFDWVVPREWNCREAYIIDPNGNKICDSNENNLHLVGYSVPIDKTMSFEDLDRNLYSLPNLPEAIPYVTSYYEEAWGFCLAEQQRQTLKKGDYKVYIDSRLEDGELTYGELLIEGEGAEEIFLSTYVCHPSMANNELSGPAVTVQLAKYIESLPMRRYAYRIIFIPETIGSIMYLSKHIDHMKKNVVAGFNISCVGDNNSYSYLPSRNGDTLSDKVALHVLNNSVPNYITYSFLDRGSDERQYCAPNVDLPICCITRSKYGAYKEYHTSLDNMDFISADGLNGAYDVYVKAIDALEHNYTYQTLTFCEPQLGKRGLYPTVSTTADKGDTVRKMMNFISYCDRHHDLLDIADKIEVPVWELYEIVDTCLENNLIEKY